jgi:hypothetical protein
MGLIAGTKLGRYEIRSKLAEGGMGEVYRFRRRALRNARGQTRISPTRHVTRDAARDCDGRPAGAVGTKSAPLALAGKSGRALFGEKARGSFSINPGSGIRA